MRRRACNPGDTEQGICGLGAGIHPCRSKLCQIRFNRHPLTSADIQNSRPANLLDMPAKNRLATRQRSSMTRSDDDDDVCEAGRTTTHPQ